MGGDLHVICILFVKCQKSLKMLSPTLTSAKMWETLPLPLSGTCSWAGDPSVQGLPGQQTRGGRVTLDVPSVKWAIIITTTTEPHTSQTRVSGGQTRMWHKPWHVVGAEEWSWGGY